MRTLDVLSAKRIEEGGSDAVSEAVQRLASRLPERSDVSVVLELLEDDLREGLAALSDVEAHFTDILDTLRSARVAPISLLEAGEDQRVLSQVDAVHTAVSRLRRRLSQSAHLMKRG